MRLSARDHVFRLARRLSPRAGAALVVAAALLAGASLAAHSDAASRRLLSLVASVARARGIELQGARAALGWNGALRLDAVRLRAPGVTVAAERVDVRPDWLALARGERVPAAVSVDGADLDLDLDAVPPSGAADVSHGDAVRELALDARHLRARVRGGRLTATTWRFTRLTGVVRRAPDELSARVEAVLPSGGTATGELVAGRELRVRSGTRGVTADDLAPELRSRSALEVAGGLDADLELEGSPGLANGRLALRASSGDLTLSGPTVGAEPVGPLALRGAVTVSWSRTERRVYIEEATLEVGPDAELAVRARGDARLTAEGLLRATISVAAPDTARLMAVLPAPLRPPSDAPPLAGGLTGEVALEGPWSQPLDWTVQGKLDLRDMRAAARALPASWLASAFDLRVTGADGTESELAVGRDSPDFVPLAELPSVVADAVVTSEDGGFWGHQGLDFDEIKRSLVAVAAAGRPVRGGSTITQQLAKNLFLSREKTFARKAREALVALALESSLPKARLLEIYLNVIEWGPGIHGIGPAARAYFGKDARELTAREAAYLASIIPNPVRYYAQYERGEISPEWGARLDTILTHMTLNGRLDADAYAAALREPIVFRN